MCGRFTLTLEASVLQQELDLGEIPGEWIPRYNIAPTQPVLAIRDKNSRNVEWLRWGLIPSWARDEKIGNQMINARAETVDQKPSFRNAFKTRRCLILSDGFFEWKRNDESSMWKTAYYFRINDNKPFLFAGIWDSWKSSEDKIIESCAIITCQANSLVGPIHDRMPVILNLDQCWRWLQPLSQMELKSMLLPYKSENMKFYQVSKIVNNTKNDFPDVINEETIIV